MTPADPFLAALKDWIELSTHQSMHAFIRSTRDSNLSISQINTLFRLYHHGPGAVNELATHLGISNSAVSQLLDFLIDSGYLQRSTDPNDRRVKRIALTEKGVQTVEKSKDARHRWIIEFSQQFDAQEKAQILPALSLLYSRAEALMKNNDQVCGKRIQPPPMDQPS